MNLLIALYFFFKFNILISKKIFLLYLKNINLKNFFFKILFFFNFGFNVLLKILNKKFNFFFK